jgi:ketosteroid isomerase-like protein
VDALPRCRAPANHREGSESISEEANVQALIHAEATIRTTGRTMVQDEAHVWTSRDGKVARIQLYPDTAAMVAAYS